MRLTKTLAAALTLSILFLPGAGKIARAADGAQIFRQDCAICHDTEPGKNKLGPSLAGIVGRKSGSIADYTYSSAMRSAGLTWDEKTLDKYLTNPHAVVPGTKMLFIGVKNGKDRQALIQYLATLKSGS